MSDVDAALFRIFVPDPTRRGRDLHLATCGLARAGGPFATVACVGCGRARWMHKTRHDTCSAHCWTEAAILTDYQIMAVRSTPGIDRELAIACARALNDFGLAPGLVRDNKVKVAAAVNQAIERHMTALDAKESGRG